MIYNKKNVDNLLRKNSDCLRGSYIGRSCLFFKNLYKEDEKSKGHVSFSRICTKKTRNRKVMSLFQESVQRRREKSYKVNFAINNII